MKVDWRIAPDWANWCAVDEDGDAWWYETEPEWKEDRWVTDDRLEVVRDNGSGWVDCEGERAWTCAQRRPSVGTHSITNDPERRERIACAVLSGLAADRHHSDTQADPKGMASLAVEYADALIAELNAPA